MVGRVSGFVRLIRPINCAMMGFAVVIGALISGVNSLDPEVFSALVIGFFTSFTLSGASMVINDYWDRDIDRINEPERPIPGGLVTPNESLIFSALLVLLGLILAFITSLQCFLLAITSIVVSVAYTTRFKKTGLIGNFFVSFCIALPFIYGSLLINGEVTLPSILFASLAFLANTGREVTKGIVDVKGDKTRNVRTIAVSYGVKVAAYLSSIFYAATIILSVLPLYLGVVSILFVPFVIVADLGFAASSFMLIRDYSRENARRVKNMMRVWMFFGLLAFIAGGIPI